jgi:DNA-binding NarL/FixJ family response regulator
MKPPPVIAPVRVHIAGLGASFARSLERYLASGSNLVLVGQSEDAVHTIAAISRSVPDILVLSRLVLGASPGEIVRSVRASSPPMRIIVVACDVASYRDGLEGAGVDAVISLFDFAEEFMARSMQYFPERLQASGEVS